MKSGAHNPDEIRDLRTQMEAAAAALDFETARQLRDQINLLRGGASAEDAARADTTGIERQTPGAMGLGSSQQRVTPPLGWKPPPKPDLMTKGSRTKKLPIVSRDKSDL
jgi:hypothetical protein